jgi:type IV pilus assembly protein PilN
MRFDINLATRHYINTGQLNLIIVVALLLLIGACGSTLFTITAASSEISRLDAELGGQASKEGVGKAVPAQEYQAMLSKIKSANSIITRKSYDWLALLDRLEGVVPDGVALSSVEPDPKGVDLKIAGAALNFATLRRFVEQLESSTAFTDVYLVSHAENKVSETQKGILFSITCKVASK